MKTSNHLANVPTETLIAQFELYTRKFAANGDLIECGYTPWNERQTYADICHDIAEELVSNRGFEWDEIDALEVAALRAVA